MLFKIWRWNMIKFLSEIYLTYGESKSVLWLVVSFAVLILMIVLYGLLRKHDCPARIAFFIIMICAVIEMSTKAVGKSCVEYDNKRNIRTAIETKFVNPEFINNGVKEGDFVNDGKIWKYKVENRKIKCFLSTYTENIEVIDIDEN